MQQSRVWLYLKALVVLRVAFARLFWQPAMAKFLPVLGEIATALESGGKLVAACVTAPFNPSAGKRLLESSGQAWVDYKDQNLIACALRGDGTGIRNGADNFSKSCPGVAHVRAGVHLVRGENEEAYNCAANGTKAVGIIAASAVAAAATGGLGAAGAIAVVGTSAATSQVALDGVDTGIRSAYHGRLETAGTIQGFQRAAQTGDAVHITEAILAPVQTATIAAGAAGLARAVDVNPNPQLTAANLRHLGEVGQEGLAAPAPGSSLQGNAGITTGPSIPWPAKWTKCKDCMVNISVIRAYSARSKARILRDNPVNMLDENRQPIPEVRDAFDQHHHQMDIPQGRNIAGNWDPARGVRFVRWLEEQIGHRDSIMYDVTFRDEEMRAIYNPNNHLGVFARLGEHGEMTLAAAFPLSPAQYQRLLAHHPIVH